MVDGPFRCHGPSPRFSGGLPTPERHRLPRSRLRGRAFLPPASFVGLGIRLGSRS
ncbi:hypothetical protein BN2537_15067 [Streptomyces venezuelae]|nr:hypothetical protein BN2537_15067 [Streptomyces venezuelae]